MITRIWHGATPAAKCDEYLNLMRTVALPDYRSTPGNAAERRRPETVVHRASVAPPRDASVQEVECLPR